MGTFLAVHWLRLPSGVGGTGLIPHAMQCPSPLQKKKMLWDFLWSLMVPYKSTGHCFPVGNVGVGWTPRDSCASAGIGARVCPAGALTSPHPFQESRYCKEPAHRVMKDASQACRLEMWEELLPWSRSKAVCRSIPLAGGRRPFGLFRLSS